MTIELIVLALWLSHGKTVDDSYKNDCKLIYYPNDSDISQKEKNNDWYCYQGKPLENNFEIHWAAIRCSSHPSPPAVNH